MKSKVKIKTIHPNGIRPNFQINIFITQIIKGHKLIHNKGQSNRSCRVAKIKVRKKKIVILKMIYIKNKTKIKKSQEIMCL